MKKVIGIDIGGTKINIGLIDEEGKIIKSQKIKTKENGDLIVKDLQEKIKEYEEEALAVGIGTAGFINSDDGIVEFLGNIEGFSGLHLKEELEKVTQLPVFVENDANIAALCEYWIGSGKEYSNFIMLTMGTGLGGAIFDEKLGFWKGSNYQGAELGHIILHPNGRQCNCSQKGCAEKYVAGSSLSINYEELTGEKVTGEEIIERLNHGDENSRKALDQLVADMGVLLTTIKNIFDPEAVIIGGGFIESREYWWDDMVKFYEDYCNRPEGMEIVPAMFKNDAGLIGAAKLAWDKKE
ncbi:MAG: ROK family protein [Tissierellia bacterium]|nr:ROK family protein [Tissierellia bacterium]